MSVKTYASGDIVLTIGGNIISGFPDGTFISVEREADAYTKVTGADGETARSRMANRSGSLTLTLSNSSNSNYVLYTFLKLDEGDDSGIFDVLMEDANMGETIFASYGWIKKPPTVEKGAEMSDREWAIDLGRMDYEYADPNA